MSDDDAEKNPGRPPLKPKKDIRLVRTTQFRRSQFAANLRPDLDESVGRSADADGEDGGGGQTPLDATPVSADAPSGRSGGGASSGPTIGRKLRLRPLAHPRPPSPPPPGLPSVEPPPPEPHQTPTSPPSAPPPAAPEGKPAPPPPALHEPKPGEGLRELSSRPALKKRPPVETAPPEPVIFDPEKKARLEVGPPDFEQEARENAIQTAAGSIAVLAFLGGQVLSGLPALRLWRQTGRIPTMELMVGGGFCLVFALLVFSRKTPLKVMAGIIAGVNMIGTVAAVVLWLVAPRMPWVGDVSRNLPPPGTAVGALCLFFASLLLLTGAGLIRFTIAGLAVLAGIGLPWLPWEPVVLPQAPTEQSQQAKEEAGAPSEAQVVLSAAGEFIVPVPKSWTQVETRDDGTRVYRSPDSLLLLKVVPGPEIANEQAARAFADEQLQKLRDEFPGRGEMRLPIPGRPGASKLVLLASPDRAEVLIVPQGNRALMLIVSGPESAFQMHRDDLDAMYRKALGETKQP